MSGSAYGIGSASGSTAQGGRTTSVQLRTVGLDPIDKKVVCKAICVCSREPDRGASGQHLKQQCVSRNLRDVDRSMDWQSPYKAEVNYDMRRYRPLPSCAPTLLSKLIPTFPAGSRNTGSAGRRLIGQAPVPSVDRTS